MTARNKDEPPFYLDAGLIGREAEVNKGFNGQKGTKYLFSKRTEGKEIGTGSIRRFNQGTYLGRSQMGDHRFLVCRKSGKKLVVRVVFRSVLEYPS